jgi:hypothetical protein
MPVGVCVIQQNGKTVLFGNLAYFRMNTVWCSLCREMESAVASRPWFVQAHAEYLNAIKGKR